MRVVIILMLSVMMLVSCKEIGKETASDYATATNWLKIPENTDEEVDTIYFYPTAYIDADKDAPTFCDIDNDMMRTNAQGYYAQQASVFEQSTNVYAPFYRQVNLAAVSGVKTEERDKMTEGIPMTDAFAALDYYFDHYNNGRPFILAGHSQGSIMLKV